MSQSINDHLVLISGPSAVGKSASFMNLKNPEGVMYLGTEAGKRLPFPSKFKEFKLQDPLQVYEGFTAAEGKPDIHTIIIDSVSFLLEQYETQYVLPSANGMKAWSDYQQFFKTLMQTYVAGSTKNVLMTTHTAQTLNESEMVIETKAVVKGALKGTGIEAYFSCVVGAKKVPLKTLKDYSSKLLNITPEDELLGYKYVYQTKLTKDTVHERIRSPIGMFSQQETYIDNDAQKLLDRLKDYYS
jgi:hypothetical protein